MQKLTVGYLRRLIAEERAKLKSAGKRSRRVDEVLETGDTDSKVVAGKTREVDADEYADTLEQHIDMLKALKIREGVLKSRLKKVHEAREAIKRKMMLRA